MKAELLYFDNAKLAEGPFWDDDNKLLYWVDITKCEVHSLDPSTGEDRTWQIGQPVGAAILAEDGSMMLACEKGFISLDLETAKLTNIVDPEDEIPGNRFNDGKCDAVGRFLAGTMDNEGERKPSGGLYSLDDEGITTRHFGGVTTSNGLGWSSDNKTFYYIDTPTMNIDAFDYDIKRGIIENRRTVFTIPDGIGRPDGMTIDAEGMLWVAHWEGWRLSRIDPAKGEIIDTIEVPAERVTSACFGGDDYETMYITTAAKPDGNDDKQPYAGGIFTVKPGVKGTKSCKYKGVV